MIWVRDAPPIWYIAAGFRCDWTQAQRARSLAGAAFGAGQAQAAARSP
jgi:hypothetical protein